MASSAGIPEADATRHSALVGASRASLHPLERRPLAASFFEGALLGNGGLGAVVCVKPDAVAIHLGHNAVWDIRVAEDHADEIGTFQEIFERVRTIDPTLDRLEDDAWYREYLEKMQANYHRSYPRPFPCGTLILGFDRGRAEALGYRLDIATGCCQVRLLLEGRAHTLEIFTDMTADRLWLRCLDERNQPAPGPFHRVRLMPDPVASNDLPKWTPHADASRSTLTFHQLLPAREDGVGDPRDRALRVGVRLSATVHERQWAGWSGSVERGDALHRALEANGPLVACLQLEHGLACDLPADPAPLADVRDQHFTDAARAARANWEDYWQRSAVALDDALLERTWYHNLYFLHCSVRPGVTCPGLFANWSYGNIGTAWHGDYHMNYNTQQPFWVTFSSNHIDKHEPYVHMVHHLLPISRKWAREYYGLRGAFFPHSAYPTQMNIMPYPVPTWGWEICETPWTVQSLWWHYRYTLDRDYLEQHGFEPIRDAVLFLVDYITRPEARGSSWGDDRYHIFPTVPPELYGLKPGFRFNHDCLVDLTLTRFVLRAFIEACDVLGRQDSEAELLAQVRDVLAHLPDNPTADSPEGTVFVSVPGEDPAIVCNVPNHLMSVFPGEEVGVAGPADERAIALNTARHMRTEGGNELVFENLQRARLGVLDLERFKRQIAYCLTPNGTCADMVLQVDGRYTDSTPYDFMSRMGVWFENFALPVVINECLMQSHDGVIRLFVNWPLEVAATFRDLRAVGAVLVSAACADGEVQWVRLHGEAGGNVHLHSPWPRTRCTIGAQQSEHEDHQITLELAAGETAQLVPAERA